MKALRHNITVLLAVGFLSACSAVSGSTPASLPTFTPLPPQPTSTPTPLPTPTPTPVPMVRLSDGHRSLTNGSWDDAVVAFQGVLNDPGAAQEEIASAQIGLAHAAYNRGDFVAALAVLDAFIAANSESSRLPHALFLRGDTKRQIADYAGAISDYSSYYESKPGLAATYVYERIAESYLALGQLDDALTYFDLALQSDRYSTGVLLLRERLAVVYRDAGMVDEAVLQYRAILSVAQNSRYRASIDFLIGQAYFEAARYDEAYDQFYDVFLAYPQSSEALEALRTLLEAGIPVNQYQRGLVNYYSEQYDIAVEAFYNYMAQVAFDEVPPDSHLFIAYSYRKLGNPDSALQELDALLTRYTPADTPAWGDAWLEKSDIFAEKGDFDTAFALLNDFVTDYNTLPEVPDAYYKAGQLAEVSGDTGLAIEYYRKLSAAYPADKRPPAKLYELGLEAFRSGDYGLAEALFSEVSGLAANEQPAASAFWQAKALMALNRSEEAANAFNQAVVFAPETYYGLRASDIMAGTVPFASPTSYTIPADPDTGRAEAEQWILDTFGIAETLPLAEQLRGDIAQDIRMERGKELWDIGLTLEAKQDFEALRQAYANDPLASYQLAIFFRELGLYRSSILAAARLHVLSGVPATDGPAFLARLRYPTYFSDLVIWHAESYSLDPLFVFALIEQESLFEGFAVSSASAQGLMQIWPPTGRDIAARLSWPNYSVSDLQRPVVNVNFGTWLLADEFKRFDGNPYPVLAAYNAGSGRAINWMAASAGDQDMFVEVISLAEPRAYVQAIYRHYSRYRLIYGNP